ncbi:hypothetical protein BDN70DRAFT_872776 [Pholiota conissans]|uniref:FHA domain-containing protein n=1 Tax=Pholiota conissans TaxID=109636 RepID=A0A9P5ZCA9_9AGAR|nr:hypothetical protein BDN70DRAFT_872776 [Pholiota conissans]
MDTTGFNQVGRYGTLSLLKRRTSTAPAPSHNDLITSFGIDEPTLTFGSTSTCGVRLYYPDVDPLHCQLGFEDGKAFLTIFGKGGVFVDGCWVYPHSASTENHQPTQERQQTIIPVSNNTEFEIHHKRFRFTYPPKEVRKTLLLATPAPAQKRALRLSMIQSAQVFSPRPSKDPRENLRILQSPLKPSIFGAGTPTKTPMRPRAVSPLKYSSKSGSSSDEEEQEEQAQEQKEPEEEEEEIVLVHTNHPRVVEEDRDLVILEDVPMHLATGSPSRLQAPTLLRMQAEQQTGPQPPRTPRRKSLGGNALHRAVLIRSAQRAVWRAEKEKEEEEEREEEMEVLGTVVDPVEEDDDDEDEEEEEEDNDVEMRSPSSEGDEEASDDEDDDEETLERKAADKSLWRKSLEKIIPWGFGASADDEEKEEDVQNENGEENAEEDEEEDAPAPLPVRPAQTPIRRALGSFMTPQVHNPSTGQPQRPVFQAGRTSMAPPGVPATASATTEVQPAVAGPGRYSLGGGEARRVIVQQPWRVKDLVLPPVPGASSTASAASSAMPPPATPAAAPVAAPPRPTPVVTEEERRAIQERRRSAVREFKEDTFWKDGAPGMSPAKNTPRMSVSPAKQSADAPGPSSLAMPTPRRSIFASPTKGRSLGYAIAEEGGANPEGPQRKNDEEEDEELDTRSLLERMRETVDDMKRRRSIASTPRVEGTPAPIATVEKPILLRAAPTPAGLPTSVALATPERQMGQPFSLGNVKKLDFTRITTPGVRAGSAKPPSSGSSFLAPAKPAASAEAETTKDDAAIEEEVPFTLLRPARETSPSRRPPSRGTRSTRRTAKEAEEKDETAEEVRSVPLPVVVVDPATEEQDEEQGVPQEKAIATKAKAKGRSRLLRAPKPVAVEATEEVDVIEDDNEIQEPSRSRAKSKTAAKPRSRSAKSPTPAEADVAATLAPATRRQRSRTPQPPVEEEHVEPAPKPNSRRTRKGTAELEEPTPAPTRRGRKPTVEPESEAEVHPEEQEKKTKTPTVKRGRKPRVATVEEEPEEETDTRRVEPTPAAAPVKRSRSRKAAPTPEPQDLEDDEHSSGEVPPSGPSKTKSTIPVKASVARGRKKAVLVKQESDGEPEEPEAAPLATARGGRTVRANTATKTPATSKTAVPATVPSKIAKPRGKLKVPATAPAASVARLQVVAGGSADTAEKENTPGPSGSAVSDEDAKDAPVKVRMSKRTGATTAAAGSGKTTRTAVAKSATKSTSKAAVKANVKVEDHEDEVAEEDANRGRKTRVTRTRATKAT